MTEHNHTDSLWAAFYARQKPDWPRELCINPHPSDPDDASYWPQRSGIAFDTRLGPVDKQFENRLPRPFQDLSDFREETL